MNFRIIDVQRTNDYFQNSRCYASNFRNATTVFYITISAI